MSTEGNIIIDGGFEEGFDGWVLSSQSSIFVESSPLIPLRNTLPLSPKPPID
ncbi:hypothetical protein HBG45_001932 [Salmonella enterica subsp. diarizonae]|nr:hypothetical protein [Salmonella enterica subsp. diarizonae]EEU3840800.1 hypothetical protein [Salmonella enterica subsp. diarizonae]EGA0720868.1 hypothetical protein [Salmonella enterica subsp. diarizonae serovar 61:k:1,5,(7)]EIB5959070.1 hypothetical protein [Salmonella enterica subsp. diarizonae]